MSVAVKRAPESIPRPALAPEALPAARPACSFHRFSVGQYHRMIAAGILTENDRVELLDGLIVAKMTHNPPHDAAVSLVNKALLRRLAEDWVVRVQSAVTLAGSEPEPDVAVVRGPERRYTRSHPRPKDVALLVEVAESTVETDREGKGRLYARARIPVYWLVNLPASRVEVYTQPRGGRAPAFRQRQDYGREDQVPLLIAGEEVARVAVRDLLP
ncbi:MAG TPA: Uma2 family endonuclease [Gemmataceae bacterium]|nr:Uma2 family endonuclease [Gemmataceae bacterium]